MSKVLDEAVTSTDDGETWDFRCPGIDGSPCGDPATGQPFSTIGWPTKKIAQARGAEHFAEHKGHGLMSTIEDFRAAHGLVSHADGIRAVRIEDLP